VGTHLVLKVEIEARAVGFMRAPLGRGAQWEAFDARFWASRGHGAGVRADPARLGVWGLGLKI
jgi:hypothetical protein